MVDKRPGELMASLLAGGWRENPPLSVLSEKELRQINTMLQKSGAGGLAWWRIRQSPLRDTSVGQELHQAYRLHTIQMAKRELEIQQIFQILHQEKIDPILVKGWAIARLYAEKGLRINGDIDLFVPPADVEKTQFLLENTELKKYAIDIEHLDLRDMKDRSLEALYSRSQIVRLGNEDVRVLGAEDHVRLMAIHLLRHGAWRPIWFCDIAVAIESRPANFDWDLCLGNNKRIANWVETIVILTHNLLDASITDTPFVHHAKRLPEWIVTSCMELWERWSTSRGIVARKPMTFSLRHPSQTVAALSDRWPNPISATVTCKAKFSKRPRFSLQMATFLMEAVNFFYRKLKA